MMLLVYAVVYLILISLLLGTGVAAGWLLHGWVPDIDRNTATLAGVVAAVAALYFAVRLFGHAEEVSDAMLDELVERELPLLIISPSRRERKPRPEKTRRDT